MMMLANAEDMIPSEHPLRKIKQLADACLKRMNATLDAMYDDDGRDSIPPERLLKCQLLSVLLISAAYNLLRIGKLLEPSPA